MKIAAVTLTLCLALAACVELPTGSIGSEPIEGHPGLSLVHEVDDLGEWVTVVDDQGTEWCMILASPGETFEYDHVADVCGWTDAPELAPPL